MRAKAKGSNAERELVKLFWEHGWAACRVAGSGSMRLPSPDLMVGGPQRLLVIECKVSAANIQYFTKQEMCELQEFAARCGAEPWVAVKFNREAWYFAPVANLEETPSAHKFSRERARLLGFSLSDILQGQSL